MPEIKLLKGVPIPRRHNALREQVRNAFARMEIGESFELSPNEIDRTNLYRMAGEVGIRISVSAQRGDTGELVRYLVWRIE